MEGRVREEREDEKTVYKGRKKGLEEVEGEKERGPGGGEG